MTPMVKKEYIRPTTLEIAISGYNMVCASITIDDEEINTGGRAAEHNSWQDIWKYME